MLDDPKLYLWAILGVFFAHTVATLFGIAPFSFWPNVIGAAVGGIYGWCRFMRSGG